MSGMEFGTVTALDVTLKNVSQALDEALQVPLNCASVEDVGEWVTTVETVLAAKMSALRTKSVAAATDMAVGAEQGFLSTDKYVASRASIDPTVVRVDGKLGAWLNDYPILGEAHTRGVLSREHVQQLKKAANKRVRHQMGLAQEMFVEAAIECDWKGFEDAIAYWLLHVDPDGAKPKEQLAKNRFSMSKGSDGRWKGSFDLDAITGTALNNAVEQEDQRLYDQETDQGHSRSASNRKAVALANLINRGAGRSADGVVPYPLIHIVMGAIVAQELAAQAVAEAEAILNGETPPVHEPVETSATDIDRRCELVDGTPIHPDFGLAVMAVAQMKRIILEPESAILDLGRDARSFTKNMKLAMLVAARGRCSSFGCDAPFSWLQDSGWR